jgi:sigma-B regulation protein RsbU (phosphoserine phosphatase)
VSANPRTARSRVLVVDDELAFINQTKDCLEQHGYEVITARNGKDALAILDREKIDLVLLDIIMPLLNGVEVTKIIKRNPATREIPVIVISTMTEYKDRVEFFRIGANDYMPKPIDNGELMARVELQLSLIRLRGEVEEANQALLQKNRMLEQHVARIENDLAVARNVQRALLPEPDRKLEGVKVTFKHMSSENLGSDFVDYLIDDNGIFHMIFDDVSGHGIASALFASQLKVLFVSMTARTLPPRTVMDQINHLSQRFMTKGYYYTAIYLQYDRRSRQLVLVNAGHPPLLLLEKATGKVKQVESSNSPLGLFPNEKYHDVQLTVGPGDKALLFTDGLTEHVNAANEMFEVTRVVKSLRQSSELGSLGIINQLLKEAKDFGSVPVFTDDVTVAVVDFDEAPDVAAVEDTEGTEIIRPVAH